MAAVGTGSATDVVREVGTAVAYNGITFQVPADLPVSKVSGYDFSCRTYTTDGVFLAADAEAVTGASCPLTTNYARTIHVQPVASEDPGDRAVEGVGARERWVATTAADPDGWYEAVLPAYGVMFTFYGLDAEVREAALSSVQGNDNAQEPARTTITAAAGTLEGTWHLAAIVRGGNRVPAAGDAFFTIAGGTLTGADECGNGISTTVIDGTIADPGAHFLIGCNAAEVNGHAFWDVLGRETTYELREGGLCVLGGNGDNLIFTRSEASDVTGGRSATGSDRATTVELFGGLSVELLLPTSVRSGDELVTTLHVENRSGGPVTDPGCELSNTLHGLVPADDPEAELSSVTTADCLGPLTYAAGAVHDFTGPTFRASTSRGDPLAPGSYLATIEVNGQRIAYPVEVTSP